MSVLAIIGVVVALSTVVAAIYDHRARHHGWRTGSSASASPRLRAGAAALHPFSHREPRY